jgi:hypothetical protein
MTVWESPRADLRDDHEGQEGPHALVSGICGDDVERFEECRSAGAIENLRPL